MLRDGLWTEVARSEHPHEREGLAYVRRGLPDREPYRAWSNFTFVAEDGKLYEVDLLVVTPGGVYLVELKAWSGKIEGDPAHWTWTTLEGKRRTVDNPRLLADRKAKKLKSLLLNQPALRRTDLRLYVEELIFLHSTNLTSLLDRRAGANVFGVDPQEDEKTPKHRLPGLLAYLTRTSPRQGAPIDRPASHAVAQALTQAGVKPSVHANRVGPYDLRELLAEGEHWQDWRAEHRLARGTTRRLRIFLMGRAQTTEERQTLERAARREFELLHAIAHPGIDRPVDYVGDRRGPVQIFDYDEHARRLDLWLADHNDELDVADRIDLVRSLAEALRFAHSEGLAHRALTPASVTVVERDGRRQVRIGDWQTVTRTTSHATAHTTSTSTTSRVGLFVTDEALRYVAPEVLELPDADARRADLFSLGALAVLILSGQPPAADLDGLRQLLRAEGSLTLSAVADAANGTLDLAIQGATAANPSGRLVSVDEFLEFLDAAIDELTAPDLPDPLDASAGQEIAGGWTVTRRIGSGSTSIVLRAERDGREEVLKVARDDEAAARLRDEHAALEALDEWRNISIVRTYGLEEVAGRTVLRLEAAAETLAHRLQRDGPVSLDLLERFGVDLLTALGTLERAGVNHRDVKPDNIGIIPRGKNKERHLVVFDFSLARTDPADLRAGTVGYTDPFLAERDTPRWDLHAERYAAAVVLHEMATGTRPVWGDGQTAPELTDEEVATVSADLLDASVRDPLAAFFRRALHRRSAERFESAEKMLEAFRAAVAGLAAAPAAEPATAVDIDEIDLASATGDMPVRELGLSPRHLSVLDRLNVTTLDDLAAVPPMELNRLRGVGAVVRRDVATLAQRVREQLDTEPLPAGGTATSIDKLAEGLVPKPPADARQREVAAAFLGLGELGEAWPSQRGVAETLDEPRDQVMVTLASARARWRRRPELTAVRTELIDALRARGGVAGGDELAAALLATRGSEATGAFRGQRARAVVRAAVEAEATLDVPRLRPHRLGERYLVALSGAVGDDGEVWDAETLLDAAAVLGEEADRVAAADPLEAYEQAVGALRAVALPDPVPAWPDARLVRIAAAASQTAAVSSRLELYPVRMPADRAVAEARATLLDRAGLTVEQLRKRVATRFPEAEALPGRPELDRLLAAAGTGLEWTSGGEAQPGRFCLPERGGVLSTRRGSTSTATTFPDAEARDAAVRDIADRLDRLRQGGGFLALTVDPRRVRAATAAVAAALDAEVLDVDAALVEAMHRHAADAGADWQRILAADAADPASRGWTVLRRLVGRAVPDVEARITGAERLVAASVGLLARYDRLDLLERLREQVTRAGGDGALEALVVVVPGDDPTARPILDGKPVPVVTANHWAHLPAAWLRDAKVSP